jgi:hypothetical protein
LISETQRTGGYAPMDMFNLPGLISARLQLQYHLPGGPKGDGNQEDQR